ncbi:hypothetical protein ACOSQ2_008668 [Xanthoceras sorbifolium]
MLLIYFNPSFSIYLPCESAAHSSSNSGESSYSLGYVTKHWLVWHVKLNQKELS